MAPRRGVLLVNANSRRGVEWFHEVRTRLQDGGFELIEANAFSNSKKLIQAAKIHIDAKVPLIAIGGGDGTLGSVAHLFAERNTVLGVLPLGTGNSFARDLGIEPDIARACDAILNGEVRCVDMGLVGERQFINLVSVGLTTHIASGLHHGVKRLLGKAAYAFSLAKALATVQPFHVVLEIPSGRFEFDSLQVLIGNGNFSLRPPMAVPTHEITAGNLTICALTSTRKLSLASLAMNLLLDSSPLTDDIKVFHATSGRLYTNRRIRVTVDGEVCMRTPFEFGIAPGALRVAVPAEASEN